MMNSFFPWIGGKKLLRKAILAEFPPMNAVSRYIEVFGGAGWVLFAKEPVSGQLEVINDIDGNLVNLYRCIKYHCGELQRELDGYNVSREQFFDCKAQLNVRGLTDIQRAARYYVIIRTSFGADQQSFGTNRKNLVDSIEYLPEIKRRLKYVLLENKDCTDLVKVYDRPDALFYLDPPYLGAEQYFSFNFGMDDHQRLHDCLAHIKGKFILSYNNEPFINELYAGFNIIEVERNNNLVKNTGAPKYKEVIIKNY